MIEIYTSDKCPQCSMAKKFLKENKIEFKEYNILKNAEAKKRLIGMGYMSVPVLIINESHVLGFDVNRIKNLLEIK